MASADCQTDAPLCAGNDADRGFGAALPLGLPTVADAGARARRDVRKIGNTTDAHGRLRVRRDAANQRTRPGDAWPRSVPTRRLSAAQRCRRVAGMRGARRERRAGAHVTVRVVATAIA
jgi:hypothetical protein